MLSRRSFAKLCGLSTIPLFTGLEAIAAPKTKSVALDSNLFMPDVAQVFTKTDHLEFPQHGSPFSTRLIPYMTLTQLDYDSKHKSRTDLVNRVAEVGVKSVQEKIEMDMLNLLFCCGLESAIVRPWKFKNTKWTSDNFIPPRKFIMAPETIEDFGYVPNPSENLICSFLLGKDQPFQEKLLSTYKQKLDGDLCLRIDDSRADSIILTHLPNLPPLMGFNTSFEFDARTCKVTEKPFRKDGREVMCFAYFCAMGVLDHRSVALLDLKNI